MTRIFLHGTGGLVETNRPANRAALDTGVVRVSKGHFCKGRRIGDRGIHGGSGQGLGRTVGFQASNEEMPLRVKLIRWEYQLKGGIAVKNMIVRLALIGSSISAIVLAGGAGKGLR